MERYRNKYRIQSTRMRNWDYGWNGGYFVTICTHGMETFFGRIVNNKMWLNDMGVLADLYWKDIPKHFPFVELDEYVVMPNHMHGIIIINNQSCRDAICRDAINRVSTIISTKRGGVAGTQNPMFHNNLSRIIRWYKGRTTFEIRKKTSVFQWQPRFYEHVIRNNDSYDKIKEYIKNNPGKWNDDKYYKDFE